MLDPKPVTGGRGGKKMKLEFVSKKVKVQILTILNLNKIDFF
jgi:hypothetical protein